MIKPFGTLSDGRAVHAVTLGSPDGLQAEVLTFGGILRRLTLPGQGARRELIVSLPDLEAYERDASFQGVIVGRVANRIAGASFDLHGRTHRLTANDGMNQLHGGREGFSKKVWRIREMECGAHSRLWLELHSAAGEEGFPGNLHVVAELVVEGTELCVRFEARADETTPVSLTIHPYFHLSGRVDELLLRIPALSYLPVKDGQLIPTGEIAPVIGTPFDFRSRRSVHPPAGSGDSQLAYGNGYDHCWVLDPDREFDAELYSPDSQIALRVSSDQPGIQFYGGQHLGRVHAGLRGVCLEPQAFPNAVNEPAFPSPLLMPGTTWRADLRYQFSQ